MSRWTATADEYQHHAGFVPELVGTVLGWLDAQPGERILDLGCGDGRIAADLMAHGAEVVAVDSSSDMVAATAARGVTAFVADAAELPAVPELAGAVFDKVFTNAVLHWVGRPEAVAAGVAGMLEPGGRFVGEFGGHGNVAGVLGALRSGLDPVGHEGDVPSWYFPTPEAFAAAIETAGFIVDRAELVPRPTPAPTGLRGWLTAFAESTLAEVDDADAVLSHAEELLAPKLRDAEGTWHIDYVRLRFAAHLPPSS